MVRYFSQIFIFSTTVNKCGKCAEHAHCEDGRCVCNDGYLETPDKRCVAEPGGGSYRTLLLQQN